MKKFILVACYIVMSVFSQVHAQYYTDYYADAYQRYMMQRQQLINMAAQYANGFTDPWKDYKFPEFRANSGTNVPPPSNNQNYQNAVPQPNSNHTNSQICAVCNGSGKCRQCGGAGQISAWRNVFGGGVEQYMKKCPSCHTGICTSCNGRGEIYY